MAARKRDALAKRALWYVLCWLGYLVHREGRLHVWAMGRWMDAKYPGEQWLSVDDLERKYGLADVQLNEDQDATPQA